MAEFPARQFPERQWGTRLKGSADPDDKTEHEYLVSTDTALLELDKLMDAFSQGWFYWGNPLPEEAMRTMIGSSLCFGLYIKDREPPDNAPISALMMHGATGRPQYHLIGFARLATDCVTIGYLTDFYVLPEYQGVGLGKYLLSCVDYMIGTWPNFRRLLFFTCEERSKEYYEKVLGAEVIGKDGELYCMGRSGPGKPSFAKSKDKEKIEE